MKRVFFLTIALILLLNKSVLIAQDSIKNTPEVNFKYGIGGGAGFATGYGLSFRYIPKKFGGR